MKIKNSSSKVSNYRSEETTYKLLTEIEKNPETNQRKLALALGVSNGKINYLLSELVEKGFIEVIETTSNKYGACLYKLTPVGLVERVAVTSKYLQFLLQQQQSIDTEIELLQKRQQTVKEEIETLKSETNQIGNVLQKGISKLRGKGAKSCGVAYDNAENRNGVYLS